MPDLLVLVDRQTAERMDYGVFSEISSQLCYATFRALRLDSPQEVVVLRMTFDMGYNAPNVQILGIASHSEERAAHLEDWKLRLREAVEVLQRVEGVSQFLVGTTVEVWPTMPLGMWDEVPVHHKPI